MNIHKIGDIQVLPDVEEPSDANGINPAVGKTGFIPGVRAEAPGGGILVITRIGGVFLLGARVVGVHHKFLFPARRWSISWPYTSCPRCC